MSENHDHDNDNILSETDHFIIWSSHEADDVMYHIELGGVTLHLTSEEWEELAVLVAGVDG